MNLAAALMILAQSVSPQAAEPAGAQARDYQASPVAVQVRVSARVIRPARFVFVDQDETAKLPDDAATVNVQRARDAAGTVWMEYN